MYTRADNTATYDSSFKCPINLIEGSASGGRCRCESYIGH